MFPIEEPPQVVARTAGLRANHEGHNGVCELKRAELCVDNESAYSLVSATTLFRNKLR